MLVQSLDHWPIFPTAVRYALGFFHTQCGRSTSQSRLPKPELDLTITLSGYTNILKRNFLFLSFYKGSFHPYFKAARLSLLTCTPLLILYNIYIKLAVRLACVKHLDSVHSEPSSNSIFIIFVIIFLITFYVFFFLFKTFLNFTLFLILYHRPCMAGYLTNKALDYFSLKLTDWKSG